MSTKPVPEEWAKTMRKLGYTHRGAPSISRLASEAGLSVETVRRYVHRIGEPEAETVAALSEAMRMDVSGWVGSKPAADVYVGPDSSRWLNDRQRLALTELINCFVKETSWPRQPSSEESESVPVTDESEDLLGQDDRPSGSESGRRSRPTAQG